MHPTFSAWAKEDRFQTGNFLGLSSAYYGIHDAYSDLRNMSINQTTPRHSPTGRLGKNQLAWCESNIPGFKNLLEDEQ